MGSKRISRISEEIKKIVSELIIKEIKDPRMSSMTTITEVEVTNDLRYANIYISVLGNEKERESTIEALQSASGFIRREIGKRIKLRYIPEPKFNLDKSIENGIYISKLIDSIKENGKKNNE
ncbi:30S ribosome-binding factor RbfA [Clostridium sp. D2Q-14]|uniref:30S ribosome-binding factor RbfA n=1 Tax=Anaeromonas gelatinilytica TaxID=2683194 RepID=UPI00193AE96E|nr:30S ribosome-binding factor RbfA [Anaeromonas gelatinilytica]MBS4536005.1 30S ribosome-binding factor RbfA [Anaeromonas gelatinilytica]